MYWSLDKDMEQNKKVYEGIIQTPYKDLETLKEDLTSFMEMNFDEGVLQNEIHLAKDWSPPNTTHEEIVRKTISRIKEEIIIDWFLYWNQEITGEEGISFNVSELIKNEDYLKQKDLLNREGEKPEANEEEVIRGNMFLFISGVIENWLKSAYEEKQQHESDQSFKN